MVGGTANGTVGGVWGGCEVREGRQPWPDGWWAFGLIFVLLLAFLICGFWGLIKENW